MRSLLLLLLLPTVLYAQARPTAGRIMGGSADPTAIPCNSTTTITDVYIRTGVSASVSIYVCRSGFYVLFAGGGDVAGPASSINNQFAFFSGVTGKLLKANGLTFDGTTLDASGARIKATEFTTDSANPAQNGNIRLNEADFMAWRNEANSADITLSKDNSNRLVASGGWAGSFTINSPFTLGATSVTASGTEINHLVGVSSGIQGQLDLRTSAGSVITDNAIVRGDGGVRGVQSSGVLIDDSNNVTVPGTLSTGDGTVEGESRHFELTANGSEYSSWLATTARATTVRYRFPTADPTAGQVMLFGAPSSNISTITWGTPGTVTASGGALTANALVLGAGTTDTKVVAGLTTDGTSKVTLGVAGSTVGSIDFKNATSGTITVAPVTGALGTNTLSLPAATGTITYTVASGTSALATAAISSGTCATAITTTATGTATTDVVMWGFNTDVTGITGYAPVTTGALTIFANPITNNVVFRVCNLTSASITPGAVTLNWRVAR